MSRSRVRWKEVQTTLVAGSPNRTSKAAITKFSIRKDIAEGTFITAPILCSKRTRRYDCISMYHNLFSFLLPTTYPVILQRIFQNAPSLNGNNPSHVIEQGTHEKHRTSKTKENSPPLWDPKVIMQLVSAVVVSSKHQIHRICGRKDCEVI